MSPQFGWEQPWHVRLRWRIFDKTLRRLQARYFQAAYFEREDACERINRQVYRLTGDSRYRSPKAGA